MSMNTPIGNITQTTPIKDFKELDEMQNEQYLLGIDNNAVGNGSKISLENLINSSISTDSDNLITKGADDRLLVNTPVEIGELSNLTTTNKSTLVAAINEVDSDITAEATTRANADNNLQSQIDAITAASDVTDIVGTYAQLQAYDTTGLPDNSVIKVLQDESRQDETTYYRWVITGGVGAWVLIGEEGPYYTISQSDSKFATQATVGNLNNLATSDKSSVVNAMNELASVLDPTQTADYIKNSKAIYSGEVSENALILPQIKEMAHSTFDLSKFTVVGSPNITDDGIASGFSSDNYLTKTLSLANTFEIQIKIKTPATYSTTNFVLGYQTGYAMGLLIEPNKRLYWNVVRASDIEQIVVASSTAQLLEYNTDYYIRFGYKNGAYYQDVSTDGISWANYGSVNSQINASEFYNNLNTYIGRSGQWNNQRPFGGLIDLKQFSITVDGVEVFSGNKTGIDTIKPDDYTVVGTPTITPDGIASGLDSSNYIQYTTADILSGKSWKIIQKVYWDGNTDPNYLKIADGYSFLRISIYKELVFNAYLASGDSQVWNAASASSVITGAGWYYIGVDFNYLTGAYSTLAGTTEENIQIINTVTKGNGEELRELDSIHYVHSEAGKSDLNSFKIYVDGNLVYQPCLKIPYTEAGNGKGYNASTGSKIVNAIYRDRVNDMAEQFGYANYYTLDEDNGNFTLPQVEIYGYIEKRARDIAHPVAQPFYRFSDEINEDEVRLEGAEVDKGLYLAIEQDPYLSALCTAGSTTDKICLPDFRNRVIYGDVASGYVEPELPNITGGYTARGIENVNMNGWGAFQSQNSGDTLSYGHDNGAGGGFDFDASRSSSIYKNGGTVKTAGVKARWLCRWK